MKKITLFILVLALLINCAKIKIKPEMLSHQQFPNWTMYGFDAGRTNYYDRDVLSPPQLVWRYKASSAVGRSILAVDGILFFNTLDGRLYALDIQTGNKIGHKKIDVDATCAYIDTCLMIAVRYGDDTLFKYDLNRAKYEWKIDAGDIASEPLLLDNEIIISALYQHLDKYDLSDGSRIWQFKTDAQIRSSPAFHDSVIVFGCDNGFVYGINHVTGELLWKFKTNASVQATPAIKDSLVYIGSSDTYFYALHLRTGKLVWKHKTDGQIFNGAALNQAIVAFGSTDEKIYCLNRFNGKKIWTVRAKSVISTPPLICNNWLFFGSLDHHFYGVDLESGKIVWKFKAKGRVKSSLILWGNYLIGASENNNVYAFSIIPQK